MRCGAAPPQKVLVTPSFARGDLLPAVSWRIELDQEKEVIAVPSRSIEDLKQAVGDLLRRPGKTRWRYAFDVVSCVEAGMGTCLQFRVYSNASLSLVSSDDRTSLLAPVGLTFAAAGSGISAEQALIFRAEFLSTMKDFYMAVDRLSAEGQTALLLCDFLSIALDDALKLLQAGQPGEDPKRPIYGTVGQWRSTAKDRTAQWSKLSKESINLLLEYHSNCYFDPRLSELGSRAVGGGHAPIH